jgi:hypothetical protein
MRQSPELKTTWHFIRHEWMQSKRSPELRTKAYSSPELVAC